MMLLNFQAINAICATTDFVLTSEKGASIKGQVREIGIPIPCRVRLFEKMSGRLIADVLTDENGFYEFDHLTKTKFFLVAHHPTKTNRNALVFDNITPK